MVGVFWVEVEMDGSGPSDLGTGGGAGTGY